MVEIVTEGEYFNEDRNHRWMIEIAPLQLMGIDPVMRFIVIQLCHTAKEHLKQGCEADQDKRATFIVQVRAFESVFLNVSESG